MLVKKYGEDNPMLKNLAVDFPTSTVVEITFAGSKKQRQPRFMSKKFRRNNKVTEYDKTDYLISRMEAGEKYRGHGLNMVG